jgi:hypothetical protein
MSDGACNSNSHAGGLHLSYFCTRKTSREIKCNGVGRLKEICHRKAQHYRSSLKEEKPLQFWSHLHCCQKTTITFCEGKEGLNWTRGEGEKGKSVTTSLCSDLDPGDGRNSMMCRWNSQITSDCRPLQFTLLTPSPLPPPCSGAPSTSHT